MRVQGEDPLAFEVLQLANVDELRTREDTKRSVSAVLLNLGSCSVADLEVENVVDVLRAELPEAAIVAVTDLDAAEELRQARRLGLSGLIPTSLDLDVSTHVLRLVIAGGLYFPVERMFDVDGASAGR